MIADGIKKKLNRFNITEINKKSFNLNEALKQAIDNSKDNRIPIVVFSKNQDDVYISMKFIDFINLTYPDWNPSVKINKKSVIPLVNTEKIEETVDIPMNLEK